jgi:glycosyltransferase involved in cell wall biosynthesis
MVGRLDRDPPYVEGLRSSIVQLGLDDHVVMTGLRTDVGRLLAAADVFLHTALEDPHPRAVIEAMASGLPVVALAVDGVSETVVDGETGFLVSSPCTALALADPVSRLLESPELSRAMGDRGRERTRLLFSADRTAREVADVILELIGAS